MKRNSRHARLLIYSHDSFGLGHLRRCSAIAHSLVGHRKDLSVLILSGSPIIGSFDFRNRVDFVRVPGVIKLRGGDYTSLNLEMGIDELLAMRASIIRHTAEVFAPDIMLVDKEPLGLRGEVKETLAMLKAKGVPLVLGLRDVIDDSEVLADEWARKNALPALEALYDHIWIYGLPEILDPLQGIAIPQSVQDKVTFTGYLRRGRTTENLSSIPLPFGPNEPYILVTPGGGGDGGNLIDWVLRAYEHDSKLPYPAILVLGPFMHGNLQSEFMDRARRLDSVAAITFDAHVERLVADAIGVVAMGGYNLFCEILSFDKPGLVVPRTVPRMEQYIRAARAQELGLVRMLPDGGNRSPEIMAAAIRELPQSPRPSSVRMPALLDGLSVINGMIDGWLTPRHRTPAKLSVVNRNE